MGIPPIAIPQPPAKPVLGATPRIAPLPSDASTLPTDSDLVTALHTINLPAGKAILAAYKAFGDRNLFEPKLNDALAAIAHPVDKRLRIHIGRLGAEAYVLGVDIDENDVALLGYTDRLDRIAEGVEPVAFLHFIARRLLELSSARMDADMQRLQMDKTIDFFSFVQAELDRKFPYYISSEPVLAEYRTLMFEIMEKHYQLLLDGLFASARGTAYKRAVKQLADHFRATAATDRVYKTPAKVPAFHIDGNSFRDYFNPNTATQFTFQFYSESVPPLSGAGPEVAFHEVIRKRYEQVARLADKQPGLHSLGGPSFPDPPILHDNSSWQEWARRMWDTGELGRPTITALESICRYVADYFRAFTVHVPYDLTEGSGTKNYLTRVIPRAITGALVHDCVVYAIRWIYILGRLFTTASMPRSLTDPRIHLVEMPAHVGVMMRARGPLGKDVLIAINNQDFELHTLDPDDDDEFAANYVVLGMYAGIKTPILIHEINVNVRDASALWTKIAKLSDSKANLPYVDSTEPHLPYLSFNVENAKIQKQLGEQLAEPYRAVRDADAIKDPTRRRSALNKALDDYQKAIPTAFKQAADDFSKKVKPIATAINTDIDEKQGQGRLPPKAIVVQVGELTDWVQKGKDYDKDVAKAKSSLDLTGIDPEVVFPSDGFPIDVQ